MDEKEKQFKNSILYMLQMGLSSVFSLITIPIFTRILNAEDFGILALAQVYAVFMSGLSNFGLIIGYERNFFQYKEKESTAQLLYSTLFFVAVLFLLFGVMTYIFREYFAKWIIGSSQYGNLIFWSFCSSGVINLKNYYLTYYKNSENAKAYVWYTFDESVLGFAFSLFLVAYMRIGVIGLVWGQLLASVIIFLVLGIKFTKNYPVAFSWDILKDSLKISFPLTPRIFFGIISSQFDKYMIGLLNTVGGVGIYSIGQRVSNAYFNYTTAIQNVYSPQVYKRMFDMGKDGGESVGRYLTPFAYITISLGLVVSLFSEELMFIMTPPAYHGAADIVILLSMLSGLYFFGKQPQLIFAKKTHISSLMTFINISLNVGINIPFIHKWGIMGAAWGNLIAGSISTALSFIVSQHYYKIKWEYKRLFEIYGSFVIASLLIIVMRYYNTDYLIRLIMKIIFLMIFGVLGYKIKVFSKENLNILLSFMGFKKI